MPVFTRRGFALLALAAPAAFTLPARAADDALLVVTGAEASPRSFSRADLEGMEQHVIETKTNFTDGRPAFRGPRLGHVLSVAGLEAGSAIKMTAANDYAIEVPFADIAAYDPILAMEVDGVKLTPRSRGPIWVMYPVDTLAADDREINDKLIWQLIRIEVM